MKHSLKGKCFTKITNDELFNIEITSSQVQQSMESGNLCYHRLERHVMSCGLVSCWAELRWSHHSKLHYTTLSSLISSTAEPKQCNRLKKLNLEFFTTLTFSFPSGYLNISFRIKQIAPKLHFKQS